MPKHPRHLSTKSSVRAQRERRRRRAAAAAGSVAAPVAAGQNTAAAAVTAQARVAPVARTAPAPKPATEKYGYVAYELRWIGGMVAAVAVILVVLSFVIPRTGI